MPDEKSYEQHRRDGTWPPLRYIDVLPGDTRGGRVVSLVRYTPTGDVVAVVEFPDGVREPHIIDAARWAEAEGSAPFPPTQSPRPGVGGALEARSDASNTPGQAK